MHNFVYASDCLHKRCQSDQTMSVNEKSVFVSKQQLQQREFGTAWG